jgi:predicted anti-sigma-YlaC factor YlaD
MHEPIKNGLEAYLRRSEHSGLSVEFAGHLEQCEQCRVELNRMATQSKMFKLLQAPADAEPRPGFYARVVERIEAQRQSFWSIFLEPAFGRRIAVASAAFVVLMGVYLFSTESSAARMASTRLAEPPVVEMMDGYQPSPALDSSVEQQRNAVLVNLATYQDQQ